MAKSNVKNQLVLVNKDGSRANSSSGWSGGGTHSSHSSHNSHSPHSPHSSSFGWGGGYSSGHSTNMSPKRAFTAHGIEFWGTAKSNLDELDLGSQNLIINCTGAEYQIESFLKKTPEWMTLEAKADKQSVAVSTNQIVLEWKDYKPPPETIEITFWEDIIRQALKYGITRIICCCFAGKGRTGTCLAALALASGFEDHPDDAINLIRDDYCFSAIETDTQEYYLFNLVYDLDALAEDLREQN